MHITSLPEELIESVLIQCIYARGVKRGIRMRLVCKRFNASFRLALCRSHILDRFSAVQVGFRWWLRKDPYGSTKLWYDYLVYRVRSEKDRNVGRYVEIRETAEAVSGLTATITGIRLPVEDAIRGLCWLALERATNCPGQLSVYPVRYHVGDPCSGLNMILRAPESTYYALRPILTKSPLQRNCFNKKIADSNDNSYVVWACNNVYGAIKGALANGNPELLIRVLFPLRTKPHLPKASQPIVVEHDGDAEHLLRLIQLSRQACRACFEDVVEFLLDHEVEGDWDIFYLVARTGSMQIMRNVLERGIEFPREYPWGDTNLLTEIIKTENTAMLRLVWEKGYRITEGKRKHALRAAKNLGLESMMEFLTDLESMGYDLVADEVREYSNRESGGPAEAEQAWLVF
ncbi:ankyrin [Paramyrothecium foliicola]|nr:ankyrin [Paramyrothecium foliicola]